MADSKARKLANIVDTSGNIVSPNAGSNASNLGIKDLNGVDLAQKSTSGFTTTIASTNCAGSMGSRNGGVNCTTAITNGYKNSVYGPSGSQPTYKDSNNFDVAQPAEIAAPPDGEWWNWSSYGFSDIPTSNCQNNGAYDGAGGNTNSLQAISTYADLVYGSYTSVAQLGGDYQYRYVNNCNCSYAFNCRTNCNCNCACACAC